MENNTDLWSAINDLISRDDVHACLCLADDNARAIFGSMDSNSRSEFGISLNLTRNCRQQKKEVKGYT
jgi:hypothetical protein